MKTYVTKLLPEEVAKHWDIIKYAVEQSMPPTSYDHPDMMNRVLSAALIGTVEVWAYYTKTEDRPPVFEGIGLSKEVYDEVSGTKNLLIYCLYGYNPVKLIGWRQKISVITKYAKAKGCSQVVAYSNNPFIIKMMHGLGANTEQTFISLDVNETVKKLNGLSEV